MEEIQQIFQQIKMTEAQAVMYAKQRTSEYGDKAGKQLAKILFEHPISCKDPPIMAENEG